MKYLILIAVMFTSCVVSNSDSDDKIAKNDPTVIEGMFEKENRNTDRYEIEHDMFQDIFDNGAENFNQVITVYYRKDDLLWTRVKQFYLSPISEYSNRYEKGYKIVGYLLAVICSDGFSSCENAEYRIEIK